jgi:DNA-binding CsgD family transcriptional regulator
MRASAAAVEVSLPRLRGDLPPAVVLALLRFAQDALARATGPASARRVRLRLSRDEASVALGVADDGDPEAEAGMLGHAEDMLVRLGGSVSRGRAAHGGLELVAALPLLPVAVLTPREREVLALLAAGRSTRSIAAETGMAPRTVTFHLANIYAKLGVAGRAEAIVAAMRYL